MTLSTLRSSSTLLGLMWLLSCTGDPGETVELVDPLSFSLFADGPFNVGFRSWEVTYDTPVSEGRTIVLNIWYPTEADTGDDVAYLQGLQPDDEALGNAPAAEPIYSSGYPVHVYSHGDQGWGGTSADLMRAFASHGWVAIAPDHTDNTLLDNASPRPTDLYIHRPTDIIASIDALASIEQTDPLAAANTDRVLMSGHSFGCYSTWANAGAAFDPDALKEECAQMDEGECTKAEMATFLSGELADPRVAAALTLAGSISRGFFGDDGHLDINGPMMLMSGTEDDHGIPDSWETLEGIDRSWVEINGGCHQSFALGVCDTLDMQEGFDIINTYALAYARRHILADDTQETEQVLDGSLQVSSQAVILYDTP